MAPRILVTAILLILIVIIFSPVVHLLGWGAAVKHFGGYAAVCLLGTRALKYFTFKQ